MKWLAYGRKRHSNTLVNPSLPGLGQGQALGLWCHAPLGFERKWAELSRSMCGFTLIEVLVALAIVSVTLAAGLRVTGMQVNNAQRQMDLFRAQLCAENALIELRLARQLPDTGDKSLTCEQLGIKLEGVLHVQATPNPSFRKVDAQFGSFKLTTVAGRF